MGKKVLPVAQPDDNYGLHAPDAENLLEMYTHTRASRASVQKSNAAS